MDDPVNYGRDLPAKSETPTEVVLVGAAALLVTVICVGLLVDGALAVYSGTVIP